VFLYLICTYTVNVRKTAAKKAARKPKKRSYESPARQRQADETRSRIAAAARKLLVESGYAGMTIPAVARAAGVAVPTVYAIFGSKTRIVAELLDEARFGEDYQKLVQEVRHVTDPVERLAFPARIARQIYESEVPVEKLLRGAGMLAPELAGVENERECQRHDAQAHLIDYLRQKNALRPGLDREAARDILWSLTSRELYRMLVRERKWTGDEYEAWLKETLRRSLTDK
jgi:TetR/AcrR family transcriptional regulator, regulator of cefoperazone and chloramphenicol sensitivity